MKKLLLPLLLLAAGCQKDADTEPNANAKAEDEIEIETQGNNCGVALVLAKDQAKVEQVIGRAAYAPNYLALKLDTALWVRKNQTLYVRIRKPNNSEYIVCTAMGPGYMPFVVTSARVK